MPHPDPHPDPCHHPRPQPTHHPQTRGHSLADRATRATAMSTVASLAGLAGYTSYSHMRALAERVGEHGVDAHAFPLTVDGLDLIGVLVLLADRRTGRASGWLPWAALTVGTLASIAANVAVAPPNPIARGISGWSAVALLAAAKLLAHLLEPAPVAADDDTHAWPGHAWRPDVALDAPGVAGRQHRSSPPMIVGTRRDQLPEPDTASPPGANTHVVDAARRLPTSETALRRWRRIWAATRHLDHADADTAAAHGVSLRTLQFIRAAGQAGHLPAPDSAPPTAPGDPPLTPVPPPAAAPGPASTASPAPLELAGLP